MAFDFSYPGTFPSAKGWGPGWPNCNRNRVVPLIVDGVEFVGGIRQEVRELAERLLRESVRRGYIADLMSLLRRSAVRVRGSDAGPARMDLHVRHERRRLEARRMVY